METNTTNKIVNDVIEIDGQILWCKGEAMIICNIDKITEKAVKIDYTSEGVWGGGHGSPVFTYTTWIPKSVIINNEIGGLTVKPWFIRAGIKAENVRHIKKYFLSKNKRVFL